jgi:hypothetical protein
MRFTPLSGGRFSHRIASPAKFPAVKGSVEQLLKADSGRKRSGGFRIEGLPGNQYFRYFEEALEWTEKELTEIVREIAKHSGTTETAVDFHVDDHTHTNTRNLIFMGCGVLAELKGEPSY